MIELPCALAESGVCSSDRACHGAAPPYQTFRDLGCPVGQCHLSASRMPPLIPEGHQTIGARRRRIAGPQPTKPPPRLNRPAESRRQPIGVISWGWVPPYTGRKVPPIIFILPQSHSTGFVRRGNEHKQQKKNKVFFFSNSYLGIAKTYIQYTV